VLAYLSRYTHRVAISNQRLLAFDETGVTFRYKDYRRDGPERQRVMTLAAHEFIRRFLLHVLPHGFHRIRHYGHRQVERPPAWRSRDGQISIPDDDAPRSSLCWLSLSR
jgi:Putative transposase